MADSIFAIGIGEKYTRIVDLSYSKGKINLFSMGQTNTISNFFSDDSEKSIENQAEIISKLISDLKINKKTASVIIPDSQSFSQIMEFSKLNEKELLSAVKYQSDQFIPMAIDEVVFDIEILKENKELRKNTILIVASPKKQVDRVEKTIEMAGIVPESLENELSSYSRFVNELQYGRGDKNHLVINFGFQSTSLYLVESKSLIPLLTRTVKVGYDLFIKELKFNFELQESKAIEILKTFGFEKNTSYDIAQTVSPLLKELINEIVKIITFSKEKFASPISKIVVFNHSSMILSFEKKLSELLTLPVEQLLLRDILVNNPLSQTFATDIPSYIAIMGGCIK